MEADDAFMTALLDGLRPEDFEDGPSPVKPVASSSAIQSRRPPLSPKPPLPSSSAALLRQRTPKAVGGVGGSRMPKVDASRSAKRPSPLIGKENTLRASVASAGRSHASSTDTKAAPAAQPGVAPGSSRISSATKLDARASSAAKILPSSPHTPGARVSRTPKASRTKVSRTTTPLPSAISDRVSAPAFEACEDWNFDLSDDETAATSAVLPSSKPTPHPDFYRLPLFRQYAKCRVIEDVPMATYVSSRKRTEKIVVAEMWYPEPGGPEGSGGDPPMRKVPRQTIVLADDWSGTDLVKGSLFNLAAIPPHSLPSLPNPPEPITLCRQLSSLVLVLHPNTLVSATSIASAATCTRRSVLQERIRSSKGEVSEALLMGNIVHEVIQSMLRGGSQPRPDEATIRPSEDTDVANAGSRTPATKPSSPAAWRIGDLEREARRACVRHVNDLFVLGKSIEAGVAMASEKLRGLPVWSARYLREGSDSSIDSQAVLTDAALRGADSAAMPRVALTEVLDTEEDILSPKFGIKGKVDVSVRAMIVEARLPASLRSTAVESPSAVMPLEIKTGRSVAGLEHRAQTMLYTLLMSDRYSAAVPAGMLFYTATDEMIRVEASHKELAQLLVARNDLASYLHVPESGTGQSTSSPDTTAKDGQAPHSDLPVIALPEVLDDDRTCGRCHASHVCMLYRKTVEGCDEIPASRGAEKTAVLFKDRTSHLTPAHADFFTHWDRLVSIEERQTAHLKRELWELTARQRQRAGRAFADMEVDRSFEATEFAEQASAQTSMEGRFLYRLLSARLTGSPSVASSDRQGRSLLSGHIAVNDAIAISIEGQNLAFAKGFVLDLTPFHVVVAVDHRLEPPPGAAHVAYRVDKDELQGGMGRIRDNIAQLFYADGDEKRRHLIVDLQPPRFRADAVDDDLRSCAHLNEDQRAAVAKVIAAEDYAVILGMPGTGKTTTIAEVILALVRQGKSILLTSYTHSAVDTIVHKIADSGVSILRLGNRDKVHPSLHRFTLDVDDPAQTVEAVESRLMTPQIVATTSLSIGHPLFSRRRFDYCIVDEASQITLPTCLGPLRFADVFVLVGDHNQLPPLVKDPVARTAGLQVSLFKRLAEAHPHAVAALTRQYRMNEDIMSLSNALVYDGRLSCGDPAVGTRRLSLPRYQDVHTSRMNPCDDDCWIADVLDPARTVIFLDTDALQATESRVGSLIQNEVEAGLIYQLIKALLRGGCVPDDVAVITPYRQQIKLLQYLLEEEEDGAGIEVLTADKSQGRDKECVIMSLVRSNKGGQVGDLLRDWRRINVCVTRARSKLVLVGSRKTLGGSELLGKLVDMSHQRGWVYALKPGAYEAHPDLVSSKLVGGTKSPTPRRRACHDDGDSGHRKRSKLEVEGASPLTRDVLREIL